MVHNEFGDALKAQENEEPSQVEQTVLLQDLIAELREEIRKQNEKIKKLEEIIEERNNENEEILFEAENGEKMTIDEYDQWNEEQVLQEEIDDLQEGKNFISSLIQKESKITLTEKELEICRKIIPANQYAYTLELTQGVEGDFYKQKLKDIAKIAMQITTDDELVNNDGFHNVGFHYFVGNSDFYISQLYPDGTAFGYTILNGDVEMAEWGYQNIEEIINVSQWIEMDYYVPEGMTIERMVEKKYPEYYIQQNENILKRKKTKIENDKEYARELADWIIQYGLENSVSKENYIISYDDIIDNTDTTIEWLNKNYELVNEALAEHNDNELLEHDPEESNENDFNLYFCSNATEKGENTLFKQNKNGRWVRKTDEELELELQEESELENEPVYTINGIEYLESEIEAGLREDIRQIFQEYDTSEIEENLVLNNVKLYKGENIDQLSLLVEYDSKNPNNKWTENALFNALAEENISFAGMKVDINPITPEKSGTIEEYFDKLNSIINENLFESEVNKVFNAVTNEFSEKYKDFYTSYDEIKEKQIENNSRYVGDYWIRNQFEQAHTEMLNLREAELKEIIKQSSTEEIAIKAATRYINYYGNLEGELASSNLYLQTRLAHYENGNLIYPSSDEIKNYIVKEYHENTEQLKSIIQEPTTKKDIKQIREQCEEILQKPDNEISAEEKLILAQYEGAGGINIEDRTSAQVLSEFYTPNNVIEKVWDIVDAYNPNGITVLEPTAGTGKFANNRPNNQFTMHELDETSARINKILHPGATVIQGAYQKQFLDENERIVNTDYEQPKYDIVIGNPPYGEYSGKYKNLEGKHHNRYEEYFIEKGLDALKDEKSILAFVVPSGFLDSKSDKVKEIIASKGILLDAYRLPASTFSTTDVGTDIIVMKPWTWTKAEIVSKEEMTKVYADEMSNNNWFKIHPEKILGEVIQTTNQFGKLVDKVVCHEGLSIQDELNKIDFFIKDINIKKIVENNKEEQNQILDVEQLEIVQDKEKVTSKKTQKNTEQKTEEIKEKVLAPVMTSEEFAKLYGKNFKAEELPIWRATNWEGIIDTTKLSFEEENLLHESDNYVEIEPGQFTHKVLFESGDIGSKITRYQNLIENLYDEDTREFDLYKKNIEHLEQIAPAKIPMERLHFGLNSTFAEEFMVDHVSPEGEIVKLNLQESFILWAKVKLMQVQWIKVITGEVE